MNGRRNVSCKYHDSLASQNCPIYYQNTLTSQIVKIIFKPIQKSTANTSHLDIIFSAPLFKDIKCAK